MGGLSSLANVIYGTISVDEPDIEPSSYGKRPDVLPEEEGRRSLTTASDRGGQDISAAMQEGMRGSAT